MQKIPVWLIMFISLFFQVTNFINIQIAKWQLRGDCGMCLLFNFEEETKYEKLSRKKDEQRVAIKTREESIIPKGFLLMPSDTERPIRGRHVRLPLLFKSFRTKIILGLLIAGLASIRRLSYQGALVIHKGNNPPHHLIHNIHNIL